MVIRLETGLAKPPGAVALGTDEPAKFSFEQILAQRVNMLAGLDDPSASNPDGVPREGERASGFRERDAFGSPVVTVAQRLAAGTQPAACDGALALIVDGQNRPAAGSAATLASGPRAPAVAVDEMRPYPSALPPPSVLKGTTSPAADPKSPLSVRQSAARSGEGVRAGRASKALPAPSTSQRLSVMLSEAQGGVQVIAAAQALGDADAAHLQRQVAGVAAEFGVRLTGFSLNGKVVDQAPSSSKRQSR